MVSPLGTIDNTLRHPRAAQFSNFYIGAKLVKTAAQVYASKHSKGWVASAVNNPVTNNWVTNSRAWKYLGKGADAFTLASVFRRGMADSSRRV